MPLAKTGTWMQPTCYTTPRAGRTIPRARSCSFANGGLAATGLSAVATTFTSTHSTSCQFMGIQTEGHTGARFNATVLVNTASRHATGQAVAAVVFSARVAPPAYLALTASLVAAGGEGANPAGGHARLLLDVSLRQRMEP